MMTTTIRSLFEETLLRFRRGRIITRAEAERTTSCPLATPLATDYTVAALP